MSRPLKRAIPAHVITEPDEHGNGSVIAADFQWRQRQHGELVQQAVESFNRITDQIHALQRELIEGKEIRAEVVATLAEAVDPTTGAPMTKNELSALLGISRQRVDQILQQHKQQLK
jgi:hypothetical protein